MTEADLNTYKLQLQQVEAALTTDPENEELNQLKSDLEEVINLTQDLLNAQLGHSSSPPPCEEEDSEAPVNKKKSPSPAPKKAKSRWAAPDPILPVKPWQVGEHCQAIYSGDNQYHDAVINEITTDGEVSITFRGYKGNYVSSLGLLKLPESGSTTVHHVGKNKREMAAKQKEYLKEKKRKTSGRISVERRLEREVS